MNCAVATCVGGVGSEAAAAVFGLKSVKICEKSCQTLKNTVVEIWLVVRKDACHKYGVKTSKYLVTHISHLKFTGYRFACTWISPRLVFLNS